VGLVVVKDMAVALALETFQQPVQAKVMMAVVLGQMAEEAVAVVGVLLVPPPVELLVLQVGLVVLQLLLEHQLLMQVEAGADHTPMTLQAQAEQVVAVTAERKPLDQTAHQTLVEVGVAEVMTVAGYILQVE
jgi:hypothetical protein